MNEAVGERGMKHHSSKGKVEWKIMAFQDTPMETMKLLRGVWAGVFSASIREKDREKNKNINKSERRQKKGFKLKIQKNEKRYCCVPLSPLFSTLKAG